MDDSLLDSPFELSVADQEFFGRNAFVKLPDVLPSELLEKYAREISDLVVDLNTMHLPMEERSTYDRAFLQVMNLWTRSDSVRRFVFSRRLAKIAAELMGVSGVRLYHDQALYKEPGGGHTPWHADQFYWPLATDCCVTAWIPLQETPLDMGPLEFAAGSHSYAGGRDLNISDDSESRLAEAMERHEYEHVVEPFAFGEVSFHSGWSYHRAGPNTTPSPRRVMCIIYMDEKMCLKAPENSYQQADWDAWCPGATVGSVIDTPLNPVLYNQ